MKRCRYKTKYRRAGENKNYENATTILTMLSLVKRVTFFSA